MPIREEFQSPLLNDAGLAHALELAEEFSRLLDKVEELTKCSLGAHPAPNGREVALVRTHLQDASAWAKRALAKHPAFQAR